jgi:hypothetical protein
MQIELLTPERVGVLWPDIESMVYAACMSNEIGSTDLTPEGIRRDAESGMSAMFVGYDNGKPEIAMVIQFTEQGGHKGADIVAIGGSKLLRYKVAYWKVIDEWLKANGVKFVDAYASPRLAKIYANRFGFGRSCVYLRKML